MQLQDFSHKQKDRKRKDVSLDSSFMICPTSQSNITLRNNGETTEGGRTSAAEKPAADIVTRSPMGQDYRGSDPYFIQSMACSTRKAREVSGATVLQDWMLPSHNLLRLQGPATPRARNDPSVTTTFYTRTKLTTYMQEIIPRSPITQGHTSFMDRELHRIPSASQVPDTEELGVRPPVAEIRIPTPHTLQPTPTKGERTDDALSISTEEGQDYQNLYLTCQRDLHLTLDRANELAEENRQLKRHLFQLQSQLYSQTRNKCNMVSSTAWVIPGSNKRRRYDEDLPRSCP